MQHVAPRPIALNTVGVMASSVGAYMYIHLYTNIVLCYTYTLCVCVCVCVCYICMIMKIASSEPQN